MLSTIIIGNNMETKKTRKKKIDNKVLPIPMLGKELGRYEGNTFYIAEHEQGVLVHVYNSMDFIVRKSQTSTYGTLTDIVRNGKLQEQDENTKEEFLTYVSAVIYLVTLPIYVFSDAEFMFQMATKCVEYLLKNVQEKEEELKEPTLEDMERDGLFQNAIEGLEEIKKNVQAIKEMENDTN